ncbi:TPA: hypothetical protein EYP27_04290 [Candidatus Bathyarchaeota archaeon]|nr:hypothetical protein [Candidatus Bathyarchaeota archaeon]
MEGKKRKEKQYFVGVRLTEEQRKLLSQIQEDAGLSKTEILLRGLELLSEYYSLGLDKPLLSTELKRLEEEALRHAEALKRIRRREEALKEIVRELRDIDRIVDKYDGKPEALIQILLDIQAKYRWISKPSLIWVSERLGIPVSRIYQISTFYKAFSLTPQGRHRVRVCLGTACHVRGGPQIMEAAERLLGVKDGEVTPDGRFTLERVNCLGCCALGPVVVIGNEYYGGVKPADLEKILSKYE